MQLCFKIKGFDLASRKEEFEIIASTDFQTCPLSNFPTLCVKSVFQNGLIGIAEKVASASKNIQSIENSLKDDIVTMHALFNDSHPKDSLRNDFHLITGKTNETQISICLHDSAV